MFDFSIFTLNHKNFVIIALILFKNLNILRFLSSFKKVRDCKSIHEHEGTKATIQVIKIVIYLSTIYLLP